ncbi:aquaporin-like protein [Apiospora marii]|uniref:Aquaporin-like protein n=1 Tax=Apiospora marii TaxID=335849 RepID=A0ABR1T3L0_9PEZI
MAWPPTTITPKQHGKQEPQITVFEMASSLESGAQTPVLPVSPSMSTTSIPNIQQATPVSHNLKGANFHGSFAAITARHKTKHLHNRPWYRRHAYFTGGWGDRAIWRAGAATVHTAAAAAGYVGLWSAGLLAVLVAATAPGSGGHLNPMVTLSTVLCGLCPLSRGVIYVAFQMVGAAIAGGCFLGSWGVERAATFLIFGVGLDPRQAALFGPHLVPVLVGLCFGVVAFVSQGLTPGYAGANMNPAKCFGIAIATNDYSAQWIWWVGGLIGGIIQAILYNFNPPWQVHDDNNKEGTPRAP